MIDTHCHLDDYEDISKILNKMNSGYLIASGADHTGNIKVLELIEKFDHIYGTIGLHPEFASNYTEEQISFVEKKAQTRPYLRGRVCKLKGQRKTIPLIPPQRVSRLQLRELRLPPQRPCLLLLLQQSFLPRSF